MAGWAQLRRSLGLRLFISYLIVIAVGVIVLAGAVQVQTPSAIQRHIARMGSHLIADPGLVADVRQNFAAGINEVTLVAAAVSLIAASAVSIYTARRILLPIRHMMQASQRIAAGQFDQRVDVPGQDELGELARSFNQMAAELEQTERRRLELIGDVSHELRTPLGNIRSVMEGLVDGVLPAQPETFLQVQHEVMRLQRLVHDLQALSQAEAGQMALELRAVAPAALMQAAAGRLRLQFEDKGVALSVAPAAGLPLVNADAARIGQVLLNLLGNALQYTPPAGQVMLSAQARGREVVFQVQDTGAGIAAEHMPHLFERFYRVDKSRSRAGGGSGIGLTIARHIVSAHGGRIWTESGGPGQGSRFSFTLPVAGPAS